MTGACQHEFVKVIEIPVGMDFLDDYRLPPCCLRWKCIRCGAYEDELEDNDLEMDWRLEP